MKTNESAGRPPKEYTAELASVRGVIIEAAALPIEVKPIPGGTLRVLFTETDESDIISTELEDGVWTLQHRKKKVGTFFTQVFHSGRVIVELPEEFHGNLTVEGQNAPVSAGSLPVLASVELGTINAPIRLDGVECGSLTAVTKNAPVRVDGIVSRDITLETSNGAVSGTIKGDQRDYFIESRTKNAKNELPGAPDEGQPGRLSVITSNAPISLRFVH